MKSRYTYLFTLIFIALSTHLLGQFTAPRFQRLTITEGLPNGEVRQIREDADGFIWLSTSEGICRFDGYKTQMLMSNTLSMSINLNGDRPLYFDWDAQKRWWIGSDWAGVRRFDPIKNDLSFVSKTEYASIRPNNKILDTLRQGSISTVFFDGNNHVWVGTFHGLQVFDITKNRMDWNPQLATPLFDNCLIQQISKDAVGNIWAAVDKKGLYQFDKTTQNWSIAVHRESLRGFTFDKEGGILFVTEDELGYYHPRTKKQSFPYNAVLKTLKIKATYYKIHADGMGRIWVGTNTGLILLRGATVPPQLFRYDPRNPYSLLSDNIRGIYEDSKGNIWLSCNADGVCMLPNSFERIQVFDNPTKSHRIEDIAIAPDSTLYSLTEKELIISPFPYYQSELLNLQNLLNNCKTTTNLITIGKNGSIYLLTECGIWQFSRQAKKCRFIFNSQIKENAIAARSYLTFNIWGDTLLTFSHFEKPGLFMFNLKTGKQTVLNNPNLNQKIIFTDGMIQDKRGEFWSNSYTGLMKIGHFSTKPDTFQYACFHFNWKNYDFNNNGGQPLIEIGDELWWGRFDGGGLSVMGLKDTAYGSFTKANGLFNNSVQTLSLDKYGYLWAGTDLGISRIQVPTDFRHANRLFAQNFSIADGLPHNTIVCSTTNLAGDKVVVGTAGGLAIINTEGGASDTIVPKLVFTNLSILNKTVRPDDSTGLLKADINNTDILTLQHNQAFFTLEVSGLNFVNPQLTRYAYRLSGLNDDWIDNGFNNIISFNNIAAGFYTLEVKAQTNTGLWSTPKSLTINVLPPIWKRTWFILLSVLAFLSTVYGVYRYRVNQILSVQNMKNAIAADLHDDVGATLSNVNILTTLVRQRLPNDVDVLPLLKRIEEEISTSSESLDDIIWSVNPKNDSMERVLSRMRQYANEVFDAKEIEGSIDFDTNLSNLSLPMEKRRDFYFIFKEALNNLSKYANCTAATISLKETNGKLKLIVSDNGVGFDPLSINEGNGQKTMRQRAERLKGELTIKSVVGKGTRVELSLPFV
jgi:ligand-binding sensor domain-containing protein/two-component sensor histidine kinase